MSHSPCAVLFVDSAAALGGAEQSLLRLLAHLDRSQWTPHLACTADALAVEAAAMGVAVHRLPLPRLRRSWRLPGDWAGGSRRLAALAQQVEAGAVVANNIRAAFYAAPAAGWARRPFIWHMRDFWLGETVPRYPQVDRLLKRFLCRQAAAVIANSAATAAHLPYAEKVTVVHNGVDPAHFAPDLEAGRLFRAEIGLSATAPLVGMAGRLRPWKGQRAFIEMARLLGEGHPEARFLIIGGTPFGVADSYAAELQELVRAYGLGGRLTFTGHLTDVRPALAALDVFVHPGAPEPFGLVNIEAMGMEKPVVAFAHGALPEIVVDGESGLLVPPGDTAGLATAVSDMLRAPERRGRMGAAGRRRVETTFAISRTAAGVSGVLTAVLQRARP